MAATVLADRQHNGYTLGGAGSITPAIADNYALADVSASDAKSKSTVQNTAFQLNKLRHRYQPLRFFTDFIRDCTTQNANGFITLSSGTNANTVVQSNDIQERIGYVQSNTGIATNGSAFVILNDNVIRLGGGTWFYETSVRIPTLSTSSERFAAVCGFMDTDLQNFAAFSYDEGAIFGNAATYWQTVTVAAGTATRNSNHTQTTVAANTWYRLGVEVNAAGNSVAFYLNGTQMATHSSNIPTSSGQHLTLGTLLIKSVGTTGRTMDIDWILGCCDLTSAR